MYCPKCGAQNTEDVKYCRVCGANLSLVPQALSGELPKERGEGRRYDRHRRRAHRHQEPGLAKGIQQVFLGSAFFIIALMLYVNHNNWGLWMLIPAFTIFGKGIADIVTSRQSKASTPTAAPPARTTGELEPERDFGALPKAPPSVTESTTRHLDATKEHYPRDTK